MLSGQASFDNLNSVADGILPQLELLPREKELPTHARWVRIRDPLNMITLKQTARHQKKD